MNSRQGALLRALLEASDYRTSADYARRFGCSDRTIRTDVKALNSFFEHEGLATRVGRQRGAGLRLALAPGEENRLVRLLEESETEMHPRYERLCQEMIALTCYPGPHTADSLARRMFRNKQQIQSDLRWWQGILKVSGLTLSVGRQITVEGPEWTRAGFRHVHAVLVLLGCGAPSHPALAVRIDRALRPPVSGALHRRDAARPRLRVLQQRAMAVRRVPLHYGDPPSPRPWPDDVARCRRGPRRSSPTSRSGSSAISP